MGSFPSDDIANKPKLEELKQQDFFLSQFKRTGVQDGSVKRTTVPPKPSGRTLPYHFCLLVPGVPQLSGQHYQSLLAALHDLLLRLCACFCYQDVCHYLWGSPG